MISLYEFRSCREFLRAAYSSARSSNPSLNLNHYAMRLGLGHSTLKMILSGKRNLTHSHVFKISQAMKFSRDESEFFSAMALKERSRGAERRHHSRRADSTRESAGLKSQLISPRAVLHDPYILPILVYLSEISRSLDLSKEEWHKIAAKLRLSPQRVERAIAVLRAAGLPKELGESEETHYVFDKMINVIPQKQYLKAWLAEATNRVDTDFENNETFFNVTTMALDRRHLKGLKEDLRRVIEKYLELPKVKKTILCQACFQVFPILEAN